jgi:plastocyanin
VSAATNASGSTISITFSKAMVDPSGAQAQFKYQIGGGADQSFSAAALHGGDATKIDLTRSGTAIAYGDSVTISYTPGTVAAADGGVLSSFSGQSVTNTVPAYYTLTAPADFTLTLNPAQATSSPGKTLSVATNDSTMSKVAVKVKGTSGQNGKLKKGGGTSLSTALTLAGTGLTTRTLSDSDQVLITTASLVVSGAEKVWSVSDLVITQPAFTAVPSGNYTITITFTATFSS